MLPAFGLTLREALSAFLVVAVVLAYVARLDLAGARRAIRWGIGLSLPATAFATVLFAGADDQAVWEGTLALASAAAVAWVAVDLWLMARTGNPRRFRGARLMMLCAITTILIVRGAIEIALLVGTMIWHVPAIEMVIGAALGPLLAIALGVVWLRTGRHVSKRRFAQVTAIFLAMLVVVLLTDGLHEMSEANIVAGADALLTVTEPLSSDGVIGSRMPYLLIGAPLAWWLVALFWEHAKTSAGRVADVDQ